MENSWLVWKSFRESGEEVGTCVLRLTWLADAIGGGTMGDGTCIMAVVIRTGNPRVPKWLPVPLPSKTRTRMHGYGFLRVWVEGYGGDVGSFTHHDDGRRGVGDGRGDPGAGDLPASLHSDEETQPQPPVRLAFAVPSPPLWEAPARAHCHVRRTQRCRGPRRPHRPPRRSPTTPATSPQDEYSATDGRREERGRHGDLRELGEEQQHVDVRGLQGHEGRERRGAAVGARPRGSRAGRAARGDGPYECSATECAQRESRDGHVTGVFGPPPPLAASTPPPTPLLPSPSQAHSTLPRHQTTAACTGPPPSAMRRRTLASPTSSPCPKIPSARMKHGTFVLFFGVETQGLGWWHTRETPRTAVPVRITRWRTWRWFSWSVIVVISECISNFISDVVIIKIMRTTSLLVNGIFDLVGLVDILRHVCIPSRLCGFDKLLAY
ncbi:hypothetical protein BJ912DRAFT_922352 [Pholiota molesta]|nr:hypothetical protein BJ912DRAFT_922352 [Pholiota molesta]